MKEEQREKSCNKNRFDKLNTDQTRNEAHFQEASHRKQPRPGSIERSNIDLSNDVTIMRLRSPHSFRSDLRKPSCESFFIVAGASEQRIGQRSRHCGIYDGWESAGLHVVGGGVSGTACPSDQCLEFGLSGRSGEGSDPYGDDVELGRPWDRFNGG